MLPDCPPADRLLVAGEKAMKDAVARIGTRQRSSTVAVTAMGMDGVPMDEEGRWQCPRTEPQRKLRRVEDLLSFMQCGREAMGFSMASCALLVDRDRPIGAVELTFSL